MPLFFSFLAKRERIGITMASSDSLIFPSGEVATHMARHFLLCQKLKERRKCLLSQYFFHGKITAMCSSHIDHFLYELTLPILVRTYTSQYLLLLSKCPRSKQIPSVQRIDCCCKTYPHTHHKVKSQEIRVCLEKLQ